MMRKKPVVLIIEDDRDVAFLLRDVLESNGILCQIEEDGEAVLAGSSRLPDLILLDIKLRGIDGFTICRRLKKKEETKEIPVIFITALNTEEDVLEAKDAGGLFFISKPFDIDFLLKKVKDILAGVPVIAGEVQLIRKVLYVNSTELEIRSGRPSLKSCLVNSEFNVTLVTDPRDVLRRAKMIHPDIIILHFQSEKLDMADLVHVLARNRATRYTKIVLVVDPYLEANSRPIPGVDAELKLPFEADEVLAGLRAVCLMRG